MSESKEMVRGTFLITLSILITKVLGVLFIIPFTSLIGGQENMAPFTYAYAPYNIAIAVATAGVPLAASKYVAKYNAIGAYKVSQKFYKSSFIVMSITGIIGFLILYFLAPYIAELTLSRNSHEKKWLVCCRYHLDYKNYQYGSYIYTSTSNLEVSSKVTSLWDQQQFLKLRNKLLVLFSF